MPAPFHTPPEIHDVHQNAEKTLPGDILTGPVAMNGAEPGDVIEVKIEDSPPARIGAGMLSGHCPARCRRIFPSSATSNPGSISQSKNCPSALRHRIAALAILRRHGRLAAAAWGHDHLADHRAPWAVTSTTRS